MIRTESSGGWQNRDCSIALPYVCKKKPNATAERPPPGEPSPGPGAGAGRGPGAVARGDSDPLWLRDKWNAPLTLPENVRRELC